MQYQPLPRGLPSFGVELLELLRRDMWRQHDGAASFRSGCYATWWHHMRLGNRIAALRYAAVPAGLHVKRVELMGYLLNDLRWWRGSASSHCRHSGRKRGACMRRPCGYARVQHTALSRAV